MAFLQADKTIVLETAHESYKAKQNLRQIVRPLRNLHHFYTALLDNDVTWLLFAGTIIDAVCVSTREDFKMARFMQRWLWTIVIFLALIGVVVALLRIVRLAPVLLSGVPLLPNPPPTDYMFALFPWLTLTHILPGLLFMVLGPLQFNVRLRTKYPQFHRLSGRVFVICSLIIGLTALVMSFVMPAIGGATQASATALFSIYFLFALSKAFWSIRQRQVAAHREWMLRAFAIGLAVATIRPLVGIFYATSRLSGLTPYEFFGIAFWIGFVLHLLVAELWINLTRPSVILAKS